MLAFAMSADSTPVRLLQITDTHLYAGPEKTLYGVNTRASLERVLAAIRRQPKPRLVLATGDLVHDESPAGYRALAAMLNTLDTQVAAIAGNHDSLTPLHAIEAPNIRVGGMHTLANWRIVLLNTLVAGDTDGHLDADELRFLDSSLTRARGAYVLVALHHQPVPVGCAWLDRIRLNNAGEFFEVLDRYPQVRGVIFGHVHQAFEAERRGVRLMATPSTCAQFMPDSADFALDSRPPGMRWLTLGSDGRIDTQIEWAPD
jgi:3',5'-cyclic-AMP phosphodiesterase